MWIIILPLGDFVFPECGGGQDSFNGYFMGCFTRVTGKGRRLVETTGILFGR